MSEYSAPVAIGGLGGSGTRVFASLLRQAGLYIGSVLNDPLDNLWFSVLFKQREFVTSRASASALDDAARLFVTAMTRGLAGALSASDRALLERLKSQLPPMVDWQIGPEAVHVDSLISSTGAPTYYGGRWGWKEPNTHVFLEPLDNRIAGLRYIHIVRDAMDMAFSKNTWQARHWSPHYRVKVDDTIPLPVRQLRYWTAANRVALDYGMTRMPNRFMVIRYEDFCARPRAYWPRLLRFLELSTDTPFPEDLLSPTSIGRSSERDLSLFSRHDVAAAAEIGARVEAMGRV